MTNYNKENYLPSVRLGQLRDLTRLLNRKSPWTIAALKILEAVDGDTRCTSSELEQTRLLLSIPTPDTLNCVLACCSGIPRQAILLTFQKF